MAVYRMKCLCVYRKPDWLSPISDICGIGITSAYRSETEYIQQRLRNVVILCRSLEKRSVSEHRCLLNISKLWWENFLSDSEVRRKARGPGVQSLEGALNMNRLKWLGHYLRIPAERLSRCTLFLRGGRWLEDGSKWSAGGKIQGVEGLSTKLDRASLVKPSCWKFTISSPSSDDWRQ